MPKNKEGKEEFQFTRPQEARLSLRGASACILPFQFTRPQEARPCTDAAPESRPKFQFTRPQEARPREQTPLTDWPVSIHAPARGATRTSPRGGANERSFNSRARKRRDRNGRGYHTRRRCFNSRARKRRDFAGYYTITATIPFQFTRPQEARPDDGTISDAELEFQFTRPQEARR